MIPEPRNLTEIEKAELLLLIEKISSHYHELLRGYFLFVEEEQEKHKVAS